MNLNKIYFYFGSKTFESNGMNFPKLPAHKLLLHTLRHNPHLLLIIATILMLFAPAIFEAIDNQIKEVKNENK